MKHDPIDIENEGYYIFDCSEEKRNETKNRLIRMKSIGMKSIGVVEIGIASFGIPGIMSSLTIENLWFYSDEDFNSHLEWAVQVPDRRQKKV